MSERIFASALGGCAGWLFGLALGGIVACVPPPSPAPAPPDASDGGQTLDAAPPAPVSEAAAICARLAHLPNGDACPEGAVASCAGALDRAEAITLTGRACLLTAGSAAAVRACGSFVTCPQPGAAPSASSSSAPPKPAPSGSGRHR